jgi:hypothetical protein
LANLGTKVNIRKGTVATENFKDLRAKAINVLRLLRIPQYYEFNSTYKKTNLEKDKK